MQQSTRSRPTFPQLSFASELVGLIARKDTSASKEKEKKKNYAGSKNHSPQ
jgi:hypothetical protein